MLRTPEVELLDEELDNAPPSAWEIGLTIDLTREDFDDDDREDGLGFRALYDQPDRVTRRAWAAAR